MKTECPHCNTIFNITQEQLDLAEGMARCGMCNQAFNALVQHDMFYQADELQQATTLAGSDAATTEPTATQINHETDNIPDDAVTADKQAKNSLFDTDHEHDVVPAYLRYETAPRQSALATAFWLTGAVVLSVSLLLQALWLERDILLKNTTVKPYIAKLCNEFDCGKLGIRDTTELHMASRNVYTHPTVNDALMVSLTIVNQAAYAQPYPDIKINFSDVVGTLVASRQLSPEQYLKLKHESLKLLQPETPVSFNIEIQDPGKQALTYEFDFL